MKIFFEIKSKIDFLKSKKWAIPVYCFFIMLITLLGYIFSNTVGYIFIFLISLFLILFTDDNKVFIPIVLSMPFMNSVGFNLTHFPWTLTVSSIFILLLILIKSFVKKSFHFNMQGSIGIFALAILNLLPLLWYRELITSKTRMMLVLYFSYSLFFFIYLLFNSTLKKDKNNFEMVRWSFISLGLLIGLQVLSYDVKAFLFDSSIDFLNNIYYLGWGLCNEAGIMMCFTLPFIFTLYLKTDNHLNRVLITLLIIFIDICVFLTTSRASILNIIVEHIALIPYIIYNSKNKKVSIISFIVLVCVLLGTIQIFYGFPKFITKISNTIFYDKLSDNGRFELYELASTIWLDSPLSFLFGKGLVNYLFEDAFFHQGFGTVYVVYHSTIMQILASCGIVGLAFMVYHFVEKYRLIKKLEKKDLFCILVSMIGIDLYGLVDNTYGMYYFMIPLVILLAVLQTSEFKNKKTKKKNLK